MSGLLALLDFHRIIHSWIYLLFLTSICLASFIDQLPDNEASAELMLADGSIDSSTWNLIQPLYRCPLVVSNGDLRYFPLSLLWSTGALPGDRASLAVYEPWDNRSIHRFLSDFPELKVFLPLLRFQDPHTPQLGRVSASLHHNALRETCSVDLNVASVEPAPLSFAADISLLSDGAQWDRRTLRIRNETIGLFEIGNFLLPSTWGLLYGRGFASHRVPASIAQNWMFAKSALPNGLLWQKQSGALGLKALCHYDGRSTFGGGEGSFSFNSGHLVPSIGASIALFPGSTTIDTISALHGNMYIKYPGLDLSLSAFAVNGEQHGVPVYGMLTRKIERSIVRVDGLFFPAHCATPLSLQRVRALNNLDEPDSLHESVWSTAMSYEQHTGSTIIGTTVSAAGISNRTFVSSMVSIERDTDISWRITCRVEPPLASLGEIRYRASGRIECPLSDISILNGEVSGYARGSSYGSVRGALRCQFAPIGPMRLWPSISFYVNSDRERSALINLEQQMTFSSHCRTQVGIRFPVVDSGKSGASLTVTMEFEI